MYPSRSTVCVRNAAPIVGWPCSSNDRLTNREHELDLPTAESPSRTSLYDTTRL